MATDRYQVQPYNDETSFLVFDTLENFVQSVYRTKERAARRASELNKAWDGFVQARDRSVELETKQPTDSKEGSG